MKKIFVLGALSVAANTTGAPAYQVEQQVSEYIALDVVTFLIPTPPTVRPKYIWENFDKETTYG